MVPRLKECCRQGQEGVVNNDRNIILETWGSLFWRITKVLKGEFITWHPVEYLSLQFLNISDHGFSLKVDLTP